MTTRSSSSLTASRSRRIADFLYQGIETALTKQCARQYSAGIVLQCLKEPGEGPTDEGPEKNVSMCLRVDCLNLAGMQAQITITRAGGNVYDVVCTVDSREAQQFSSSFPVQMESLRSSSMRLARDLATFLRKEIERKIGQQVLLRSADGC